MARGLILKAAIKQLRVRNSPKLKMVKGLKTQSLTINLLLRQQWTVYLSHVFSKLSACFVLALKVQIHNIERKKKNSCKMCMKLYVYTHLKVSLERRDIFFIREEDVYNTVPILL